ncbi:protein FAM219A-like isoform X2 [Stegodyphus dumicola]|uniref:protein FAM219A-like isoform X2 n=1 Tax=Stegodyphus dumicola TaxID=202533 RepID=UPI0015ABDC6E|nr:protein FAM219A-like isoform X2 [Stegodyphus dumicola]
MEDSGIDSDSKSALNLNHCANSESSDLQDKNKEEESGIACSDDLNTESTEIISNPSMIANTVCRGTVSLGCKGTPRFMPTSILQKRLEKQIQQTKKIRQREQNMDGLPKKLIPRSSDEEIDYHPISKSATKEITEQLIKDGYNLDLTPDDEDLDLIPPKPLTQRCVCCSLSCMCLIQ